MDRARAINDLLTLLQEPPEPVTVLTPTRVDEISLRYLDRLKSVSGETVASVIEIIRSSLPGNLNHGRIRSWKRCCSCVAKYLLLPDVGGAGKIEAAGTVVRLSQYVHTPDGYHSAFAPYAARIAEALWGPDELINEAAGVLSLNEDCVDQDGLITIWELAKGEPKSGRTDVDVRYMASRILTFLCDNGFKEAYIENDDAATLDALASSTPEALIRWGVGSIYVDEFTQRIRVSARAAVCFLTDSGFDPSVSYNPHASTRKRWFEDDLKILADDESGRKIVLYGNADKSSKGFPTAESFRNYIREDVYRLEDGRYRFTQKKDADVIVLSRDGLIHGRFDVEAKVAPNSKDQVEYPPVKCVYLVRQSHLYEHPVPLAAFGISGIQFGKRISEQRLREIESQAGQITSFNCDHTKSEQKSSPTLEIQPGAESQTQKPDVVDSGHEPQTSGEIAEKQIESILPFLQRFEAASGHTSDLPGADQLIVEFLRALYDNGWITPSFDWAEWQDEAEKYVESPAAIDTADAYTIQKLLTTHVRKDRFCEGHLAAMFENSHVVALLRRLSKIRPTLGQTP